MISLLYVSRAALQAGSEHRQIADILAAARQRNPGIGVSGALTHIEGCFAQILEGDAPAVNQLMIDILRDRRHREVRIIELVTIQERRFGGLTMGWVPPSPSAAGCLALLSKSGSDAESGAAAKGLIDYMASAAEEADPRG